MPTIWFRNTWSWNSSASKPVLQRIDYQGANGLAAHHTDPLFQEALSDYYLYCEGDVPLLFTDNETNNQKLVGAPNASPYVKDGIHNFVVNGDTGAVNPALAGTKAAAHYDLTVPAGGIQTVRLR